MTISERAGRPADPTILVDVDRLVGAYYDRRPDPSVAGQRVAFGTSGHRGSALSTAFNEAHIVATTEAICRYRQDRGVDGPLFIGRDTHALSEPAFRSALEVMGAHGVDIRVDAANGYTPTPVISHAILTHNRGRRDHLADGIVVTPSHNPPEDGGFKYNPPNGGPADTDVTGWIGEQANELLATAVEAVERVPFERARAAATPHDYLASYVGDLGAVIDMDAIRASGLRLGVDPLGGASVAYWPAIAERYGLDLTVTNDRVDPHVRVHDRRLGRADPDGPVVAVRDGPAGRAARPLRRRLRQRHRRGPSRDRCTGRRAPQPQPFPVGVGGLPVRGGTSVGARRSPSARRSCRARCSIVSRPTSVAACSRSRSGSSGSSPVCSTGRSGSAARRAPGASFLRRDGTVWSTDKDGMIPCLLAAEMTARTGRDPGQAYERADRTVRVTGLSADRCAGDTRAEGQRSHGSRPTRSPRRRSPASR